MALGAGIAAVLLHAKRVEPASLAKSISNLRLFWATYIECVRTGPTRRIASDTLAYIAAKLWGESEPASFLNGSSFEGSECCPCAARFKGEWLLPAPLVTLRTFRSIATDCWV